jgi:hypothetical protein
MGLSVDPIAGAGIHDSLFRTDRIGIHRFSRSRLGRANFVSDGAGQSETICAASS